MKKSQAQEGLHEMKGEHLYRCYPFIRLVRCTDYFTDPFITYTTVHHVLNSGLTNPDGNVHRNKRYPLVDGLHFPLTVEEDAIIWKAACNPSSCTFLRDQSWTWEACNMALYKYVIPDRIDVLENSLIRLTQPLVFNDPFECFPYIREVAHDERVSEYLNKHQCSEDEAETMILEFWKEEREKHPALNVTYKEFREYLKFKMDQARFFICDPVKGIASMDDPSFRSEIVRALTQAINKEIGIMCLTEKMDNLLMWAHYASNHTGFVIEFNERHSFFGQGSEIGHLKKVRYSIARPEVTLLDPTLSDMEHIYHWINDIFCVKSQHWEYEQEWRMIVALRNCQNVIASQQDDICLFELPKSCITGIILGCRMPTENKERLLNILRNDDEYRHVSLRQAEMDEKEFRLRFVEIRQ